MSFDHVLPIRPPRAVPPLLKCVLSPATTLQLKALTFLIIALSQTKADKMPEKFPPEFVMLQSTKLMSLTTALIPSPPI